MLGSTQTVDMETTRKSNFGRVLVAVLNPSLIPKELDVVIADHYFELQFEVEKWGFDENGEEAAILWNGGSVEGGSVEEGGEEHERLAKKQKKDEGSKEDVEMGEPCGENAAKVLSWKEQVQHMSREEFESFLREKAGEIMNKAADKLFDELADKVAGEKEEDGLEAAGNEGMSKMEKEGERQKEIQRAAAVPEAKIV